MNINTVLFPRFCALPLLLLLWAFTTTSHGATLRAYVDRNEVRIGEMIKLTIELNKRTSDTPGTRELNEHFKILLGPKTTQYTSTTDGIKSTSTRWTLEIAPRHSGTINIPSMIVSNQKTTPIAINVIKTTIEDNRINADKPVFIHSEVDKRDVYFQEQIILIVRVFHSTEIEGKIIDPIFNTAVKESLGDKKEYRTNIAGVRYRVKEWTYAIFPQQTGELVIDSYKLEGSRIAGRTSFFLNRNTTRISEKSLPISINVKEIPSHYPRDQWLPAEQVEITESWSSNPPQFKVGEPITRTITLHALQQIAANLPSHSAISSKFFKIYPDQAQSEDNTDRNYGIQTTRAESIAIVPTKPGEFRLPEIKTYWWNTKENRMEIASIPERIITVAASPEHAKISALDTPTANLLATPQQDNTSPNGVSPIWKAIAIIMVVFWVTTTGLALYFWKKLSTHPRKRKVTFKNQPKNPTMLINNITKACHKGDPEDAKYSLIEWGGIYFNLKIISLGELCHLIQERLGQSSDLVKAIDNLQHILYRDPESPWQGDQLAKAVDKLNKRPIKQAQQSSALKNLYSSD